MDEMTLNTWSRVIYGELPNNEEDRIIAESYGGFVKMASSGMDLIFYFGKKNGFSFEEIWEKYENTKNKLMNLPHKDSDKCDGRLKALKHPYMNHGLYDLNQLRELETPDLLIEGDFPFYTLVMLEDLSRALDKQRYVDALQIAKLSDIYKKYFCSND